MISPMLRDAINAQVTLADKSQMKINRCQTLKHGSGKAFKSSVINRNGRTLESACYSIDGKTLEIAC